MPSTFRPWRVAVTRDEDRDGALAAALAVEGLTPVWCPVMLERPPVDVAALKQVAESLHDFDWVVVASARAVAAISRARRGPWPAGLRTAAVGESSAQAIRVAGVMHPPLVGAGDGSEALWPALKDAASWPGTRVLVPTTPGGRTDLAERLRAAGAHVTTVDAYLMVRRPTAAIIEDWRRAAPDAVVIASARAAETLQDVIGVDALRAVTVVAIGATTAAALARLGVPSTRPARAGFSEVARLLSAQQAMERSA